MNKQSKYDHVLIPVYCVMIILVYVFLHGIYRPENPDDACFVSIAYNHFVKGIQTDEIFGTTVGSGGYGGVLLFGKTYTHVQGIILNRVGWTKSNAHLISSALLLLALLLWYQIARKVGLNTRSAIYFALAMLIIEPFFGAANIARPDAMTFLIVSGGLLTFLYKRYLLSGFLVMLAIETHPMGVVVVFYMIAAFVFLMKRSSFTKIDVVKMATMLFIGIIIGGLYYYILHRENISLLASSIVSANTAPSWEIREGGNWVNSMLYEYFFETKYYRHIPELVFILACISYYFLRRNFRRNVFISALLLASLVIGVIVRRPNFMYAVYIYPAFLLLVFWLFQDRKLIKVLAILILIYLIPQYTFVMIKNREYNIEEYLDNVAALVPEDAVPVLGGPNAWFAMKEREFYFVDYRMGLENLDLNEFYLIEDDAYRNGRYVKGMNYIQDNYSSRRDIVSSSSKIVIRKMVKKENSF